MSGLHFHRLAVRSVRPEADDALAVTFDVPADLAGRYRFAAGQSVTLRTVLDGEDVRRSYSICAAPGEPLRVGVRRVPGGRFSTWLHAALKPGDAIDVMEPEGRFGAALATRPRHLLAVAGGSGITPILGVLKAALAADPAARATLVYANRTLASTMFREELADLKNRHLARFAWVPVFSREPIDVPLAAGRVDASKLAEVLKIAGVPDEVFVCGPHAFNDEVEAALQAQGIAPGRIHVERFGVPPALSADAATAHAPQPGDAETARITIVRDGVAREVGFGPGDESLLAAAGRAGLDVPYSCRSGVCATCKAKVLDGAVRMDRNFALEPGEVAAGFVLTCQAHPTTPRVTVSFDER